MGVVRTVQYKDLPPARLTDRKHDSEEAYRKFTSSPSGEEIPVPTGWALGLARSGLSIITFRNYVDFPHPNGHNPLGWTLRRAFPVCSEAQHPWGGWFTHLGLVSNQIKDRVLFTGLRSKTERCRDCHGCGSQHSTRSQSGAIVRTPSASPRPSVCATEVTRRARRSRFYFLRNLPC